MKKIKILLVLLFAVVFVSGCSCTSSMCTEDDNQAIKQKIKEKWENNEEYKAQLRDEAITKQNITDLTEQENYVNQNIEKKINEEYEKHPKACLTTSEMEDPSSGATIESKSWGDAWKQGLLEGLIVYPISWLLISFSKWFGGNGLAKILSIVLTTIIIRILMLAFTFRSQIQNHKMQEIQPELNAISMKLKDPNLSQAEKSRLSMKMMEIYKKNNINPLSTLLPTFISLPIFLSVWSAVSQTLVIRTGDFLGLTLGDAVSSQVFSLNITAIVLFLLMTASQIISMKLPNILRKKQMNYKNKSSVEDANKQMNTTMNIMLIMILITGFVLPSALAIYWTIGALFSITQTLIFSNPKIKEKLNTLGNRKKKAKVVQ